jgi:hypothetical protein
MPASRSSNSNSGVMPTRNVPPAENVTVTVNIVGSGRVVQMATGNLVTLEALPDPGWRFDAWVGISSLGARVTIFADDETVIGARFVEQDRDGDGVPEARDACPNTRQGLVVDENGCAADERDSDSDGISDPHDLCADTPGGSAVNGQGCAAAQLDPDADGVADAVDQCPGTPAGAVVDPSGCAAQQLDSDADGVTDDIDQCSETPAGTSVDGVGCPIVVLPPAGAVCGNGIVEMGEQCEPPGSASCNTSCQSIGPPPPPANMPATWTTSHSLLADLEDPSFYTAPESYDLSAGGVLTTAHFTLSAAAIENELGGDVTVLNSSVPLGTQTALYHIEDIPDVPGTWTTSLNIQSFALVIAGGTATWSFDLTLSYDLATPFGSYTAEQHAVGQQTGTVSSNGQQITWNSVSGTLALTSNIPGFEGGEPLPLGDILTLASWTRSGN